MTEAPAFFKRQYKDRAESAYEFLMELCRRNSENDLPIYQTGYGHPKAVPWHIVRPMESDRLIRLEYIDTDGAPLIKIVPTDRALGFYMM